ncbi:MAG: hypothetical protein C0P74_006785 [Gammaproteobacteria bacterium]|nr:hypothetical protein [Gammaproteobacteria bacterium]
MRTFILALSSVLLSVAAQFCLKAGMSSEAARALTLEASSPARFLGLLFQPAIVLGLALYAAGAIVWLLVLADWDVSKAYPLVGLGFAVTLVIGAATGDAVSVGRVVGVLLICSGVFLVARS